MLTTTMTYDEYLDICNMNKEIADKTWNFIVGDKTYMDCTELLSNLYIDDEFEIIVGNPYIDSRRTAETSSTQQKDNKKYSETINLCKKYRHCGSLLSPLPADLPGIIPLEDFIRIFRISAADTCKLILSEELPIHVLNCHYYFALSDIQQYMWGFCEYCIDKRYMDKIDVLDFVGNTSGISDEYNYLLGRFESYRGRSPFVHGSRHIPRSAGRETNKELLEELI